MNTILVETSSELTLDQGQDLQACLLPGVSRTFALTIPQLPANVQTAVANAYLLCRITDTIEDDASLSAQQKTKYHQMFIEALHSSLMAKQLADELTPLLSEHTPEAEVQLIQKIPQVLATTRLLPKVQQKAVCHCVEIMGKGMAKFEQLASLQGLPTLRELDHYCYYVAGVVGEMLTALFIDSCPQLKNKEKVMMPLAVSFGQGLQMTNILKDILADQARGICWLPRDIVINHQDIGLENLPVFRNTDEFKQGMLKLVGIAHGHLNNAIQYTLAIPRKEVGMRRFCLWAIGFAILTLKKIANNPCYTDGSQVKISRSQVKRIILQTNVLCRFNKPLQWWLASMRKNLPFEKIDSSLYSEW